MTDTRLRRLLDRVESNGPAGASTPRPGLTRPNIGGSMMADTALDHRMDSGKAERACGCCGADISHRHQDAMYCGLTCKMRAKERRRPRRSSKAQASCACRLCGAQFSPNSGSQKFCTPECRSEAYQKSLPPKPLAQKTCAQCAATFPAGYGQRKYCGEACRKAAKYEARVRSGYKQQYDRAYHQRNYERELARKRLSSLERRVADPERFREGERFRYRRAAAERALALLLLPTTQPPRM